MYILSSDIFTESAEKCCQQILMKPQYYRKLFQKIVDILMLTVWKKMYFMHTKEFTLYGPFVQLE